MLDAMPDRDHRDKDDKQPKPVKPEDLRRISTAELMGNDREIILEHKGKEYHLRITALDKLILTR